MFEYSCEDFDWPRIEPRFIMKVAGIEFGDGMKCSSRLAQPPLGRKFENNLAAAFSLRSVRHGGLHLTKCIGFLDFCF